MARKRCRAALKVVGIRSLLHGATWTDGVERDQRKLYISVTSVKLFCPPSCCKEGIDSVRTKWFPRIKKRSVTESRGKRVLCESKRKWVRGSFCRISIELRPVYLGRSRVLQVAWFGDRFMRIIQLRQSKLLNVFVVFFFFSSLLKSLFIFFVFLRVKQFFFSLNYLIMFSHWNIIKTFYSFVNFIFIKID